MISVKEIGNMLDFIGLSTDTKPTGCANGSVYYEMDTSKIYLFDKANNQWLEIGNVYQEQNLS